MAKDDILLLLQKYRRVAQLLGLEEDEKGFGEAIDFYKKCSDADKNITASPPKKNSGKRDFEEFIKNQGKGLETLSINPDIKANKECIVDFWDSLEDNQKEKFTIFELNIIRFLISNQYNTYIQKDKKGTIASVDSAVRAERTGKSFRDIKV